MQEQEGGEGGGVEEEGQHTDLVVMALFGEHEKDSLRYRMTSCGRGARRDDRPCRRRGQEARGPQVPGLPLGRRQGVEEWECRNRRSSTICMLPARLGEDWFVSLLSLTGPGHPDPKHRATFGLGHQSKACKATHLSLILHSFSSIFFLKDQMLLFRNCVKLQICRRKSSI